MMILAKQRKRLLVSALCSLIAHVVFFTCASLAPAPKRLITMPPEPTFFQLERVDVPPQSPQRQQLVAAPAPAQEDVKPTDLIAEKSTNAADEKIDGDKDANAPSVEKVSGFDQLAAPAPVPPKPAPPKKAAPEKPADKVREKVASAKPQEKAPEQRPEIDAQQSPPDQKEEEAPQPEAPSLSPGITSGRIEGGVKRTGIMAFEAMESQIAPYLKQVRARVERNWRTALHVRYSGTQPARAVLDCAIAADGHLVSVEIVEAGASPTFAPLCKYAVETAAPFGPFPFEVPDIYRSQNLEIRWTFSFLEQ